VKQLKNIIMIANREYILIVDDSQTNNVLLEAVLDEAGYITQTATSAAEAWNILHKERPALILLDLLMPKVSGFQLLEKIKHKEEFTKIPVLIVSALNDTDTIKTLKANGADDFFPKPFDLEKLIARVGDFVPH
jgi:DNA-binding response OmpR family regulator